MLTNNTFILIYVKQVFYNVMVFVVFFFFFLSFFSFNLFVCFVIVTWNLLSSNYTDNYVSLYWFFCVHYYCFENSVNWNYYNVMSFCILFSFFFLLFFILNKYYLIFLYLFLYFFLIYFHLYIYIILFKENRWIEIILQIRHLAYNPICNYRIDAY